jgi:hypothetical protein
LNTHIWNTFYESWGKTAISGPKGERTAPGLFQKGILKANVTHLFQPNAIFTFLANPCSKAGAKILHQRLETSMYTKPPWSPAAACLQNE